MALSRLSCLMSFFSEKEFQRVCSFPTKEGPSPPCDASATHSEKSALKTSLNVGAYGAYPTPCPVLVYPTTQGGRLRRILHGFGKSAREVMTCADVDACGSAATDTAGK